MLRGVDIDLKDSRKAVRALTAVYKRDAERGGLSDEAISEVNAAIRSLEGAMGKTAHEVGQRYVGKKCQAYYPVAYERSDFEDRLDKQLPGLRQTHPEIADAFARHQPYQPSKNPLRYLKKLYRTNHHHGFTLQEAKETQSLDTVFPTGGKLSITAGAITFGIGDPPPWRGIPIRRETMTAADSGVAPGSPVLPIVTTYIDWHFTNPNVSVLGTLVPLCSICAAACSDISQVAGL